MGNSKRPTKIICLVPTNHVWFSWCFFSFSNKYWKWRWIWNFGKLQQGNSKLFVLFLQTRFVSHDVSNLLIAKCKCNPFKKLHFSTFIVCNTIFLLPQFSVKSQQDTKLINFIVENIAMSKKISTLKWSREKWENQLSNVL